MAVDVVKQLLTDVEVLPTDGLQVFILSFKIGQGHYAQQSSEMYRELWKIKKYCYDSFVGIWGYSKPLCDTKMAPEGKVEYWGTCLFVAQEECDILALDMMMDVKIKTKPMWKTGTKFTLHYIRKDDD